MFIPLGDNNPRLLNPSVVFTLMAANIIFFVLGWTIPLDNLALWEDRFLSGSHLGFIELFTYQFVHGGWAHLLFNMFFLYIFGDNIEGAMGHGVFIVFYLLCGIGAALAEIYLDPAFGATNPGVLIGASGSVSGIMGAYILRFPRAKVLTWIFFVFFKEIHAMYYIGIWIALQLLSQARAAEGESVAYMAHIGGFLTGMLLYTIYRQLKMRGWL
ncbi:MAG: hypothetical protein AUJ47_10115 [Candidatus Marinimicrobia bacterium CG1_02_48_14]|nr:MAG: hypothetical protein AUJ47_10115 [Candidatus Marinimicrobia bacterium CG1_02_48_14]PJA52097.1 MAG: rhomboid family intramembrane serine protease [Candidatus Marinimicrobia bacterium CG_4_9_14_3_um_filter_48_9]